LADGSGMPDSPTSIYALSETDANEVFRSYFCMSGHPTETVPILLVFGNHMPFHMWFFADYNGGINNAAGWMLAAAKANRLVPHEENYRGFYDAPEYEHGTIGDYAFV